MVSPLRALIARQMSGVAGRGVVGVVVRRSGVSMPPGTAGFCTRRCPVVGVRDLSGSGWSAGEPRAKAAALVYFPVAGLKGYTLRCFGQLA